MGSSKSNKIELSKLQKKIEQLESKNAKLEAEKIKAEAKISKTARVEKVAKDSSKETLKEIKELRRKLMAKSMKKENIDIETIKRITGLPIDEIEKL